MNKERRKSIAEAVKELRDKIGKLEEIKSAVENAKGNLEVARDMMEAIEAGRCMLGKTDCRDYYGKHIPSRTQVKAGTKGSHEYVVKHSGEAHAVAMEMA